MFRKDRDIRAVKGHGAGGVPLFTKEGLDVIERADIENDQSKEYIW